MQRLFIFIAFILVGLSLSISSTFAQGNPDISSFTSSFSNIGRQALENRTARIPVRWTSQNRPLTANLVFEQIFADGSTINVELPRIIPWVASNGDGIAAPIMPSANATQIVLRVTLKNLFNQQVYDTAEITLPIVDGNGGSGNSIVPTITAFNANVTNPLDAASLANGTARIPVTWTAINRPVTANLIFEQVLANGTVVNVELPRPFLWVNSSDAGVVAPVQPGGDATSINLRLRLVDLLYNRVLDQRLITVPIQSSSTAARINSFTTTMANISRDTLISGNARVDVSWDVSNRPNNTNLVFEQVMPDGSVRNAELPRDVQIVPSSGNGIVAPIMPIQATETLVFQLRLLDLGTNTTLASARLQLPILLPNTSNVVVVTGDACFRAPFPPSQGLTVGGQGRVQSYSGGSAVSLYTDLNNYESTISLNVGTTFSIQEGPYCSYYTEDDGEQWSRRRWNVNANGQRGWADEYNGYITTGVAYNFIPANQSDIPTIELISFTVSPTSIDANALDSTYVTFRWQTRNARAVYITGLDYSSQELETNGELRILARDLDAHYNPSTYTLHAMDSQYNSAEASVTLTFNSNVSINSFSVSPNNARGNTQVSFSWDISGDFERASIWWAPNAARPVLTTITEITSDTGSFTFTLPDTLTGEREITLAVSDESGTSQSQVIKINVSCAYDWGISVSDADCPRNALATRQGAYQVFQRGFMIWLPNSVWEPLWVFYNDGTVVRYTDAWDGSPFTIDTAPPDGLISPERGFGFLWNSTPAVRSGLGWATGTEQAYTIQFQDTLSQGRYDDHRWYLSLPDGRLLRVNFSMSSPTMSWQNQ